VPAEFLLIGSGWRAEFFIRIAEKLPDTFQISAIVTSNAVLRQSYTKRGFLCVRTLEEGLRTGTPAFAVVCVSRKAASQVSRQVMAHGLPILAETPVASSYEELTELSRHILGTVKFQVAEQYYLRPDHAARLACIESGRLGRPVQALVSLTNNYHAISLIRKFLGEKGDQAVIRAQRFHVPGRPGFERDGPPKEAVTRMYSQTLATFDFGGRQGIYNFEDDQHRSYIRSQHIQIKGDNGEINNGEVRYLRDGGTPVYSPFLRINKGENENMEGSGLKGILFEGTWIYQNPYPKVRFSDDEIAVATCLSRMKDYCGGGRPGYSFAEAAQDFYLTLLLEEAAKTGKEVAAREQPWTRWL
jgi:predicted dehydrogenase